MVLPCKDVGRIRVVTVPEDMSVQEAYRLVGGLITEIPSKEEGSWVEDLLDALEDQDFESVDFILGPSLD
jgi:hypothetical protein